MSDSEGESDRIQVKGNRWSLDTILDSDVKNLQRSVV